MIIGFLIGMVAGVLGLALTVVVGIDIRVAIAERRMAQEDE